MVFSTPMFLFFYLPFCLLIYYLTPLKLRNLMLFCFSLLFYYWGERIYVVLMFLSTLLDYIHGMLVQHFKDRGKNRYARLAVASSVALNLVILGFFKYWDFFAASLQSMGLNFMPILGVHLPIGISFYTFQTMSYTIDVYRDDTRAQGNIITFGTFVTLFPQLVAGPIIKYKDLGGQLEHRTTSVDKFASGVAIFVVGLGKKVLLANNVGLLWDQYKATAVSDLSVAGAWLGILAFTFQIYFDFSGYSDMATGLGRMLGFEFHKNFDYPYISRSITEFWRRWHISLSSWFREYLYIPLGGNRRSRPRWIFNLLLVWGATGIWHGASWNYLIWGLYFFVLLVLEKLVLGARLERLPGWARHGYTMILVVISWAIFALEDFAHMGGYLRVMLGFGGVSLADGAFFYYAGAYCPVLLLAAFASTPAGKGLLCRLNPRTRGAAGAVLLVGGLLLCTAYLVDASYNPFLYFRF